MEAAKPEHKLVNIERKVNVFLENVKELLEVTVDEEADKVNNAVSKRESNRVVKDYKEVKTNREVQANQNYAVVKLAEADTTESIP